MKMQTNVKFHAQLSWAWKKFYNIWVRSHSVELDFFFFFSNEKKNLFWYTSDNILYMLSDLQIIHNPVETIPRLEPFLRYVVLKETN